MKLIISLVLLFSFTAHSQIQEINPIVGDSSWFVHNKEWPNSHSNEKERISQHLHFVLQKLREPNEQSAENLAKRKINLQFLDQYIQRQIFPSDINYHNKRRPCFIDMSGNICAVGYLLEKTSSREEAERINKLFQYEYLLDMKDEGLQTWQKSSGLSMKELAMIQPTYRIPVRRRTVFYNEKKNKFGTKDASGKRILLKAKYDAIIVGCYPDSPLGSEGTEMVKLKGKWAILKSYGDAVTKFKYDTIVGSNSLKTINAQLIDPEPIPNHTYLFAYKGNNVDVFSSLGKFLFSKVNCEIMDFHADVFEFKTENKFGVLNATGKELIEAKFEEIECYNNSGSPCFYYRTGSGNSLEPISAYRLKLKGKFGLMNSKLKLILPFEFGSIKRVGSNLWQAGRGGKFYLYNNQGKQFLENPIQTIKPFGDCKTQHLRVQVKGKYGVLDSSNQWVLQPEYDYLERNWLYYEVRKNGLSGILNPDGTSLLNIEYDYLHRRSDGTFFVSKNKRLGKLTAKGKSLIPIKYKVLTKLYDDEIHRDKACYYGAEEWGKWKIITDQGLQIGTQTFDSVLHVGNGCFRVKLDQYWYFGKYSGGSTIFQKDLRVEEFVWINSGIYAYKQNGKFGLWWTYNLKNGEGKLFEPKFGEIFPIDFGGNRFLIKNKGKYGISDRRGILVLPAEYQEFLDIQSSYGAKHGMCFKKNDKWFYYHVAADKIEEASRHILIKIKEKKSKE